MQTQNIHGTDLSKRYRRSSREQIGQGYQHRDLDGADTRRPEACAYRHAARAYSGLRLCQLSKPQHTGCSASVIGHRPHTAMGAVLIAYANESSHHKTRAS